MSPRGLCVLCVAFLFVSAASAQEAGLRGREILVLSPMEPTRPAIAAFVAGLKSGLDVDLPGSNTLITERVLGWTKVPADAQAEQWFDEKYRDREMDAIVAIGPANLDFALRVRDERWPHTKAFYALLASAPSSHIQPRDATGVVAEFSDVRAVEGAVSLLPATKHIFLTGGGSPADRVMNGPVIGQLKAEFPALTLTDLTGLPLAERMARCASLPPESIIIILTTIDEPKAKPIVAPVLMQSLSATANAPLFHLSLGSLGLGIVGGPLLSSGSIGTALAHQMAKVLGGRDPNSVPEVAVPLDVRFDARQLKRWGIPESRLPAGSIVEFRAPTPWSQHRDLILGILVVVLLQSGLIAWLLLERRRRRRSQIAESKSEQELLSQEALNRAVLQSLPGYVAILDQSGRILQVNEKWRDASVTKAGGFFARASVGDDYASCWERGVNGSDAYAGLLSQRIKSVLAGEISQSLLEWRFPSHDSDARWLEIRCNVLQRREGGAVVSNVDITERKRTELQAEQNIHTLSQFNRVAALGELAGALAHELNQPLASILVNAETLDEMLAQETPQNSEAREVVGEIISDDERAGQIIRKMRTLLQDRESNAVPLNLTEVASSVVKLLANEAMLRKVVMRCELAADLPTVLGDTVQLQQVVLNLMLNAMDAMRDCPEGARTVTVSTFSERGNTVVLEVRDSGPGIPFEHLPHLFDHFFTTKQDGLGLGLAISKSIMQALDGEIEAGNWQHGAIFKLSMPVAAVAAPQVAAHVAV
jgi:signal transduction histidine kinase